ncbi:MAG: hypothetical protein ACKOB0_04815 [Chthoniobacterales bacterium]
MLRWNSIHPYNVVDLVEILRPVTPEQLRAAAKDVLAAMGLGIPRTDEAETSVSFNELSDCLEVSRPSLGSEARPALEKFLSEELNRPLSVGRDAALRLALVESESHRYVAMTYQHWVMDGVAAARVLRRILAEAFGLPRERGNACELEAPLCDRAFARCRRGIAGLAQKTEGLRGLVTRTRAAAPWQKGSSENRFDVRVLAIPQDALDRLRRMARHHGCTVNDALLAIIYRAIDRALPERRRSPWHRNIAICNIADLRKLAPELQEKSGVYVGFFGTHIGALSQDDAQLTDRIRQQTSRAKKLCIPLASLATFRTLPRLWPLLQTSTLSALLRRFFRYSCGLSNLRLGPEWEDPKWSGVIRDYTRACPLGMVLPLIFGVTTRGDELSVTITSARGGYSAAQIETIASSIGEFLRTPDSERCP